MEKITTAIEAESKVTGELKKLLSATKEADKLPVRLWLNEQSLESAEKLAWQETSALFQFSDTSFSAMPITRNNDNIMEIAQKYQSTKRKYAKEIYEQYNQSILSSLEIATEDVIYVSRYVPLIVVNMSASNIQVVAESAHVKNIDVQDSFDFVTDYDEEVLLSSSTIDMDDHRKFLNIDDICNAYGLSGSGISIGIFDSGVPDVSNVNLAGVDIEIMPGSVQNGHATYTTAICAALVPDAKYYCAGGGNFDVPEYYLDWLIENDVDVINMSLGWFEQCSGVDTYTQEGMVLDYYVTEYDKLFVIANGNLETNEEDPDYGRQGLLESACAYNVLTVGNYDHNSTMPHDPLPDGMPDAYVDDSIHILDTLYNVANATGAHKPDICAPGVHTVVGSGSTLISGGGTSAAAPHVTAVAALMLELNPGLMLAPAVALKSILMAGVNKDTPHYYTPDTYTYGIHDASGNLNGTYRLYGAGLVDAYNAGCIAYEETSTYRTRTMGPNETNYEYTVTWHPAYGEIRVCLAYEQMAYQIGDGEYDTGILPDMDFAIYDPNGTMVASSTTTYNNVEIVDFIPTVSGQYRIRIICSNPSAVSIPYAVSWSQSNN